MTHFPWYCEKTSTDRIGQGDMFFECPVIRVMSPSNIAGTPNEMLANATKILNADIVILTQDCDLANNKTENIILCSHVSIDYWFQATNCTTPKSQQSSFDKLRKGELPSLHLLDYHERIISKHRIVNFHEIFITPRKILEEHMKSIPIRLQLQSPYREHLSQAFARFFMRVGLPGEVSPLPK